MGIRIFCVDLTWNDPSSRCRCLHNIFLILTVDCGTLTDPDNGWVTLTAGTTLGQTATYSCNTGYNLEGNRTRTCQATGNWSESAPTCRGMLLHSVCLCSFHENSEILLRPFLDHDASRLLDDGLQYVGISIIGAGC